MHFIIHSCIPRGHPAAMPHRQINQKLKREVEVWESNSADPLVKVCLDLLMYIVLCSGSVFDSGDFFPSLNENMLQVLSALIFWRKAASNFSWHWMRPDIVRI